MEKKFRFPLDLQLFAEGDEKSGKSNVIDPDKELEKMGDPKNVDNDTDDDLEEDEDDIDEEDVEEDEEDDLDEDEDSEDSDEDEDTDDEDSEKDKSKDTDQSKDKSEEDKSKDTSTTDTKKAPQNRNVNHEQKELRLQREREEKARKENFQKGFIAALGGKNPYTDEEIKTEDDIHEAQVMIEAKKRGLDPIQDYSKMDKILKAEERAKAQVEADKVAAAKKAQEDDFKEFTEAYPNVDVGKLFNEDKEFEEFAKDLVGNVPLKTIYDKYLKIQSKTQKAVEDNEDMSKARRASSPGTASSGGDTNEEFYTLEQLKKMSQSEINKNFKKVEKSYEHIAKQGAKK